MADTTPKPIVNGPDATPTEAVGRMLAHVGFDQLVPKDVWVEIKVLALFQEKGAMFHQLSVKEEGK